MDTPDAYDAQLQAMHESRKLEQESTVATNSQAGPRKDPPSPDKSASVEWWKVVLIVLVVVGVVLLVMGGYYYVGRYGWPWKPILPPTDSELKEMLRNTEKERDRYVCSNTSKDKEIINLKAECLALKNEVASKDVELKALVPLKSKLEAAEVKNDDLRSQLVDANLQARAAERLADTQKGRLDEMEKNQGSGGLVGEVLAAVQSIAMPAASVRPAGTAATASAPTAPAAAPAGSSRMGEISSTSASTTVEDENDPDTISMYLEGGDGRARPRAVKHTARRPEVEPVEDSTDNPHIPLAKNEKHLANYNGPPLASDDDSKEGGEDDKCSIHTGSSAERGARNNSSAFSCNGDTVDEFADE